MLLIFLIFCCGKGICSILNEHLILEKSNLPISLPMNITPLVDHPTTPRVLLFPWDLPSCNGDCMWISLARSECIYSLRGLTTPFTHWRTKISIVTFKITSALFHSSSISASLPCAQTMLIYLYPLRDSFYFIYNVKSFLFILIWIHIYSISSDFLSYASMQCHTHLCNLLI